MPVKIVVTVYVYSEVSGITQKMVNHWETRNGVCIPFDYSNESICLPYAALES